VTSMEARSPLFVVATANGGKMTWTFEPSDSRISTRGGLDAQGLEEKKGEYDQRT